MQTHFQPAHIPFKDGLARIDEAFAKAGVKRQRRILTSRDAEAVKLCNLLAVDEGLPKGFRKWQLPFHVEAGQFFITTAAADASVGEHAHDDDGVRFILSGSIFYDGIELTAGDWMYLPKGEKYGFKVGPLGASMCYCYCCCCAGRTLFTHGEEVINPAYVRQRTSLR